MRTRQLVAANCALALVVLTMASAWGGDPPGNNGTVKVGGSTGNDPHVACVFDITFWGFDEGPLSALATFDLIAPSGSGFLEDDTVGIGEDEAGGGTDLDQTLVVDLRDEIVATGLSEGTQGFHVKMTVHAEGSHGADTKHKVLWVSGCGGGEEPGEGGEG
jgi:hypothetical protein